MIISTPILHTPAVHGHFAAPFPAVHSGLSHPSHGIRALSMSSSNAEDEGSSRGFSATRLLLTTTIALALVGAPLVEPAHAELVPDKYGRMQQRICPIAYFPCYQEGNFCFRPIYCEGQFSPEGLLNAGIIFAGILGPAYSVWRRKSGLDPDPNTPEGKEFYAKKWEGYLKDNARAKENLMPNQRARKSSFFGRNKKEEEKPGSDADK